MPRPPRADEAGGIYHVLNRGNTRADIFQKQADFDAFERIMAEAFALVCAEGSVLFNLAL